ncbi:hypothetical protein M0R45_036600 [Rubus argutus]|uniref:Protein kinase domain-containing protein n=1 Tax=Rubus argutus TaxID=59490 RepID=A0AAW1W0E8_RUBAR
MSRASVLFAAYTALLLLLPPSFCSQAPSNSSTTNEDNANCTLSCGNIYIKPPFRLPGQPPNCGNKAFELSCEENNTIAVLSLYAGTYYVQEINYTSFTLRVVDSDVHKSRDNYFSNPRYSLTSFNFTDTDPYDISTNPVPIIYLNCTNPIDSPLSVETAPCVNRNRYSNSSDSSLSSLTNMYSYFMVADRDGYVSSSDLGKSCKITQMVMASPSTYEFMMSCEAIYNEIARGFELSWLDYACRSICGKDDVGFCTSCPPDGTVGTWYKSIVNFVVSLLNIGLYPTGAFLSLLRINIEPNSLCFIVIISVIAYLAQFQAVKFVFGFPCVIALLVFKWRRRHLSVYDNIEDFLQNNDDLMPIRYSYSNIKKMTRGFKEKVGEGGYGSVYKGKLRSGRLVAIKMLGTSKSNGQEFINEVATIGRIHHVNVVQLLGFCVEGSKRALVYDFMPNGSLEKYIFSQQGALSLSSEKMFKVAIGVAHGIEYLHQGCDMQILHFDIKPHNILLDENFAPKVSDFGLARLCPLDNSLVSLTAARGTMGYIAPELFYKNIGGVSYKADVYSYGMLLMEMAGRRKNLNATAEHTSQIYFPTWVSEQLSEGNDIEIEDTTEEEKKIVKKMIMVALWCIQLKPGERPSMSKVVEMLDREIEGIRMPPKPFLYPQQMPESTEIS